MQDGEPWWMLADVCKVLELSNPSKVAARLDEDEKMTLTLSKGHSGQRGGAQIATIVNESGLYSVILRSDKPQAKTFKRWVTHEVLPSIRQTGKYSIETRLDDVRQTCFPSSLKAPSLRKTARLMLYTLRQIASYGEVQITTLQLMELMNVGSEQTIRSARKELLDAGYIEHMPGVKGKPGIYKILML